jgi:hypothetical protein
LNQVCIRQLHCMVSQAGGLHTLGTTKDGEDRNLTLSYFAG